MGALARLLVLAALIAGGAVAGGGCASGSTDPPQAAPQIVVDPAPPPPSGPAPTGPRASCDRPSPIGDGPGPAGLEVRGRGTGARLWGLIMAPPNSLVAGPDATKIVWRMTGSGPLRLAAFDGRGRSIGLAWGPEQHEGSTYRRPGDEWGAGYRFRSPGCYRLTARRDVGRAEVWLRIGER